MLKLTKIVATIGPASDSEEMITKLIQAGVNVFRFNFKHNTIEWHNERIERVNRVAASLGVSIGTLIDLQGPEIRITMPTDELDIKAGEELRFGPEVFDSGERGLSISHPDVLQHLTEGQKILADDGAFTFYVVKKNNGYYLHSESNGVLKNRKSLNIPGADFPFPVLVERDFQGLQLAARKEIDYVALSFVRTAEDLITVKEEMKKFDVKGKIVAKIETQKAIDYLDEIIQHSDSIMVARGDLGVELPLEQVPYYQKLMIRKSIEQGKPVITATQMLQTMIENPYPTRAEVSDVANAVYDFTDAVMLSGESAQGKYPWEAVKVMARVVAYNELKIEEDTRKVFQLQSQDQESVICDAAYNLYLTAKHKEPIRAFVVFSHTGRTAQLLSRFRPRIPIYTITPDKKAADTLTLNFGVAPILSHMAQIDNEEININEIQKSLDYLRKKDLIASGDRVIVVHGDVWNVAGGTSTVKVMTV